MVLNLVLKMQNFSWNTVRSTRFIHIKRYYFINFLFVEVIMKESLISDDKKFLNDLFENLIFE